MISGAVGIAWPLGTPTSPSAWRMSTLTPARAAASARTALLLLCHASPRESNRGQYSGPQARRSPWPKEIATRWPSVVRQTAGWTFGLLGHVLKVKKRPDQTRLALYGATDSDGQKDRACKRQVTGRSAIRSHFMETNKPLGGFRGEQMLVTGRAPRPTKHGLLNTTNRQ